MLNLLKTETIVSVFRRFMPDSAVGELRIACGNENCQKLDHKEKFKVCTGCRVRRFCSVECLRKDWGKNKSECKMMRRKVPEVD